MSYKGDIDPQRALQYINHYPRQIVEQIETLLRQGKLKAWFQQRYPLHHQIKTDKLLFEFTQELKRRFLKKSPHLNKVVFDPKIHLVNNALGLHTKVSKVHGANLRTKREIRIAEMFKDSPEPLLNMIVVHELAHLKECDHNKGFYSLCQHMLPNYFQLELDARIFLILKENKLYT